jgi:hypothetical protein
MESSGLARFAPLSGIVAFLAVLAAILVVGETPSIDDSTREVVDFVNGNESEYQIAGLLLALGAAAVAWFGASLRTALRSAEGEPGRLSGLAFAGTLILATGMSIFAGIEFTIGDGADDLPAASLQTLTALDTDAFFTVAVGVVVLQWATALAVLRHGGLPRWLGWVSLVIGILALTPIGWIAFLATFIWIPVVGVLMYLGQGQAMASPPPAGPAAGSPRAS